MDLGKGIHNARPEQQVFRLAYYKNFSYIVQGIRDKNVYLKIFPVIKVCLCFFHFYYFYIQNNFFLNNIYLQ